MPWAFVQDDTAVDDSGSTITSLAKAFTSNVTAGNHIFVGIGWGSNDQNPTITDTLGHTYTLIRKTWDATNNQGTATYHTQNISGGANTVTLSLSVASPYVRLYIRESSGILTAGALDVETGQVQASPGTGTDGCTSGAMTTTVANTMIVGFCQDIGGTQTSYTAGTNFTLRESVAGLVCGSDDRNAATAGSYAATFTLSVNNRHTTHAAAFKEVAAAELPIPDATETPSTYKDIVRDLIARARSELAFALDSPPSLYASAAQSVAVAQASETDTAQAVGKAKVKAVGQSVETDTSIAITARKSKNLAQATETDTAQAVARAKSKSVAQSTETDTAQAIARLKTKQVAQASETDLAQPITRSGAKNIAVVQAVEVDTAQPVARSKAKTFAQALETDSAISITRLKSRALGVASETDTAQVIAKAKVKAIGQAAEVETALAITRLKRQTLQQATELDFAQTITHTKAKGVTQAAETDTALQITQFGVVSSHLRGTVKVYPTLGVGSINVTPSISGTINVN